jgi:hypothetical protein
MSVNVNEGGSHTMPREVFGHHDGHGLTESIHIQADAPGPGGASHEYTIWVQTSHEDPQPIVARIQFQKGPRNIEGSVPGIVESALLAIVIDRMNAFNAGEYRCRENSLVATKCEEAIHWLKHRADERARRQVLGTYEK